MKRFFTMLIMSIIIILLIAVLGILGYLVWQEIDGEAVADTVQNFVSTVTSIAKEENLSTPGIIDTTSSELEETPTVNVNYDNVVVDNYFYDQLEEPSKKIYKALEANKENMKTGTYQINLGNQFTDILSKSNGEDLLGDYYQSAVETYIYDNPDVFYLDVNKMYLNIETTTKGKNVSYNVFINNGSTTNYLDEGYNSESQISQAIAQLESVKQQIVAQAQAQGSTYSQIKYVHDYIVDNTNYDSTISNPDIYNIYGTLIRKSSVCEGYAKSFKYIMDALNIPCVMVIGEATNSSGESESHAWNYVQINNIWYAIDCTWDDPVVIGGGRASSSSKTRYFLKGSNTFNQDHFPSGQFTQGGKTYEYPVLSQIDYSR